MGKIFVIGVGPGSEKYLTKAAIDTVKNEKIDMIIGGKNALNLFKNVKKNKKTIGKDINKILDFIEKNKTKNIAVLTSGDPGLFSILKPVLASASFSKNDIEIIPGISSAQLAFAEIKETWEDTEFISLHGRENISELIKKAKNLKKGKLIIFADEKTKPDNIAKVLLNANVEKNAFKVFVCENLGLKNEKIFEGNLSSVKNRKFSGNSVMILKSGK